MRLTLRTLLAYLDDVLGPTEAKEIGEKINTNPEASALIARIKDVLRRRRIGAPELSGTGSGPDPNLVADYIENTLAPAEVVELERLCMESDMHLAEVAACHKVLTLVLGQPIDVPDEVRERMYVLGATTNGKKVAEAAATIPLEEQPIDEQTPEVSQLSEGLPDYLKSKPLWPRFSTAAITLLVGAVWLGLVLSDDGIWGKPEPQGIVQAPQQPAVDDSNELAANPPKENDVNKNPNLVAKSEVSPSNATPPISVNPTPPDDATIAKTDVTPPQMPIPGPGLTPAPTDPVTPKAEAPDKEPAKAQLIKDPFLVSQTEGIRLIKSPESKNWTVLSAIPMLGGEELAVPHPFRAQLTWGDRLELLLEPGTRFTRLADADDGTPQIEVNRGRIVFYRPESTETIPSINVRISGTQWTLVLTEAGTRCGIEVTPPTPEGPPGQTGLLVYDLNIGVATGTVETKLADNPALTLTADDGWTRWESSSDQFVTINDPFPAWSTTEGELVTASSRNLARIFEKEFILDQPVAGSIAPVIQNRMASNSHYAAQTLSLIDNYIALVPALEADHEETRIASIEGLRQWVVQAPENGQLLIDEVTRDYPDDEIENIVRMVWGYSKEDLSDPSVSRELIEFMKNNEIEIRELAFYYVNKFGKTTKGYRPLLPAHERKAAILRLEDYLEQNESLGGS